MAHDIQLQWNLFLWPASVYALTYGCTFLLCGSLADLCGCRLVYFTGASLLGTFTLGCGLAKTELQLIIFRVLQGIALSICLPSATSMITKANITMLSIAALLVPAFFFWIRHQEAHGRAAIIPPSLFKSTPSSPHRARFFTATCLGVFLIFSVLNAFIYFITLFYQEIQNLSPLSTSPRFLPMVLTGTATNILTGMLVHKVNANKLVIGAAALTTIGPLLMALTNPHSSYWAPVFEAMMLSLIAPDTIFTIANLIITEIFPRETHRLAGDIFNTIAQIGNCVGLAVSAVVAGEVTKAKRAGGAADDSALLDGYRASFWTSLAASTFVIVVAGWV